MFKCVKCSANLPVTVCSRMKEEASRAVSVTSCRHPRVKVSRVRRSTFSCRRRRSWFSTPTCRYVTRPSLTCELCRLTRSVVWMVINCRLSRSWMNTAVVCSDHDRRRPKFCFIRSWENTDAVCSDHDKQWLMFQEIMMDHALRTISYIADIGDVLVIMARRGPLVSNSQDEMPTERRSKICCHVFETDEVRIGRLFTLLRLCTLLAVIRGLSWDWGIFNLIFFDVLLFLRISFWNGSKKNVKIALSFSTIVSVFQLGLFLRALRPAHTVFAVFVFLDSRCKNAWFLLIIHKIFSPNNYVFEELLPQIACRYYYVSFLPRNENHCTEKKIVIIKNNIAIRIAGEVSRYIDASMNRAAPTTPH